MQVSIIVMSYIFVTIYCSHFFLSVVTVYTTACSTQFTSENLNILYSFNFSGFLAIHGCEDGYTLVGNRVRICESHGWTGSEPTCNRKLIIKSIFFLSSPISSPHHMRGGGLKKTKQNKKNNKKKQKKTTPPRACDDPIPGQPNTKSSVLSYGH